MAILAAVSSPVAAGLPSRAKTGNADKAASAFAIRTVRLLAGNRYAAVWQSLHPSHQRAVGGSARYVRCERETLIPGHVESVESLGVRDRTKRLAGIGRARTKAVTMRITFAPGDGSTKGVTVTHTVHVLLADGEWRWVLPNARYSSYRVSQCGLGDSDL
jgi:hypothetical protein